MSSFTESWRPPGAPGEKDVVATIVPEGCGGVLTRFAIFEACRAGLESNFVPTYLQIMEEIPKTASEKPQERFLRRGIRSAPRSAVHRRSR